MKTLQDCGGPIHPFRDPRLGLGGGEDVYAGATLRDYFAAKAMQAIISNPTRMNIRLEDLTQEAYAIADAMLEARKK